MIEILPAAAAAGVAFILLRKARIASLNRKLSQPIKVPESYRTPGMYVGAAGFITAYDAFHSLAMLDDRVLEAIDFSAAGELNNFHDLSAYIKEHYISGSAGSVEGALNRLEGYTAEQTVAAHLTSQGHVVEFPDDPNNPGYDLLVDGHPVQVKDTLDPSYIKEHLENYPDIPVICNAEMASYFADNPNVMVDHEMSYYTIERNVQNTVDGVDALTGGAAFHIPLVTLALSGFRETNLLLKGHTDIATAGAHIGLDTAGVGGGGFIGAKAGALAGSFLGPVGAAVGGIIGGVIGALGGKYLSSSIKANRYNNAVESLNYKLIELAEKTPGIIDNKISSLQRKREKIKRNMGISFFSKIWPGPKFMIYNNISERIADNINSLIQKRNDITAELNKENPDNLAAGKKAYMVLASGDIYYPNLNEDLREIQRLNKVIVNEGRKLGYNY